MNDEKAKHQSLQYKIGTLRALFVFEVDFKVCGICRGGAEEVVGCSKGTIDRGKSNKFTARNPEIDKAAVESCQAIHSKIRFHSIHLLH